MTTGRAWPCAHRQLAGITSALPALAFPLRRTAQAEPSRRGGRQALAWGRPGRLLAPLPGVTMGGFLTQLLISLVLLGFFLVSCQNLLHFAQGSLRFVLKHVHWRLDKELGESEGLGDDEEAFSTRVVRRRVLVQVAGRGPAQPSGVFWTSCGCPAFRLSWQRHRMPG